MSHLIIAEPWGYNTSRDVSAVNEDYVCPETGQRLPWWRHFITKFLHHFNPLAIYRLGGRLSLYVLIRVAGDPTYFSLAAEPYDALWENADDNVMCKYIHHCILHNPR